MSRTGHSRGDRHRGGKGIGTSHASASTTRRESSRTAGFALQQRYGNRAVVALMRAGAEVGVAALRGHGDASRVVMHGGLAGVSVHGRTDGTYDGGTWAIDKEKSKRGKACGECAEGTECIHTTGTLVSTYHVDVTITMPDVPAGLSECEEAAVTRFINTTLQTHENDHKRRMERYNGVVRTPFDLNGCGLDAIREQVEAMHIAKAQQREADANAASAAIDPFNVAIPNNCKD